MLCEKKTTLQPDHPSLTTKPNKENSCINFFDFQRRNPIIELRNVLDLENGILFLLEAKNQSTKERTVHRNRASLSVSVVWRKVVIN